MRMSFSGFPLVCEITHKRTWPTKLYVFFVPIMKYAISLPNTNRLPYLYASETLRFTLKLFG